MNKYLSIESLRGLAAIVVALFHSSFVVDQKYPIIAQGAIFVDLFFVLSGFVMFHAYEKKIESGMSAFDYTLLRLGRLYPLHVFLLLVWVPYVVLKAYIFSEWHIGSDPYEKSNMASFLSNLLMIHSMGVHENLTWNYPSWSISVEFFTYIVFFYAIKVMRSFCGFNYLLAISLLAYYALWTASDGSLLRTYDYGMLRCVGGFFLGAWVCNLTNRLTWSPGAVSGTVAELSVLFVSLLFVLKSGSDRQLQLAAFLSFGLVVGVFSIQSNGLVSKILRTKVLVLAGTLSYSIYMVHAIVFTVVGQLYQYVFDGNVKFIARDGAEPLKALVTPYADLINISCMAVIVLISWFTYNYVEKPCRSYVRRRLELRQARSAELPGFP